MKTLSILREEKEKLEGEGEALGQYEVGVMIETPSAAVMSGELAKLVDFFSIGSNAVSYTHLDVYKRQHQSFLIDAAHNILLWICPLR